MLKPAENEHNRHSPKNCFQCGSATTSLDKTEWGLLPHWYWWEINGSRRLICKTCYVRNKWQEKYVPKGAKCDLCRKGTLTLSKYGTQIWVRDKKKKGVFICKACFVIRRDIGHQRPQEARHNIGLGIHKAIDRGVIFGKRTYSLDDTVFNTKNEDPSYWSGFLMTDGNIYIGKTGNPRISLVLAEKDYPHLIKYRKFLKSNYPILPKKKKYNGTIVIQYCLRFSSKHIAQILYACGIVPRKSLIAKVVGFENNRHFWRGVFDGDGYFKNKDGRDGDKMIFTGSNDLCAQFEEFIKKNIPNAKINIKEVREYSKLYIYSNTARAVAKLLYSDCKIALERKLVKAKRMFQWWG